MSNPFPGMNPFLERYWGDVHTSLVTYARDYIQPQLPDDLCARVEEQVRIDAGHERRRAQPDVHVVTNPVPATPRSEATASVLDVAKPYVFTWLNDPLEDRHVEIRDRNDQRLVTSIEVLSPTNKRSQADREQFRAKQRDVLDGGASLVEIDLLRQGGWTLPVPPHELPDEFAEGTTTCVVRGWNRARIDCYAMPLAQPLPTIRVPLRATDADVFLDLQSLLDKAWGAGGYRFDYEREPWPRLAPTEDTWTRRFLRDNGLLPADTAVD